MRPVLYRAALAAACLSALALAGCGKHVASDAPITFAPADTPYLFANTKPTPADVTAAWSASGSDMMAARIQQLGQFAQAVNEKDATAATVLNAIKDELANVHSTKELAAATGFSQSALFAFYGIGDVPVMRVELASPDTFKAFWARVEKRAGVSTPTARIGQQEYWTIGGVNAKVHVLVAVEGKQLVATMAPANASADMLKQLLGVTKPTDNAVGRLARVDSDHDYSDYGSGYIDFPKLFANLFDGKDAVTQAFAKDLGGSLANPACASEFASLAQQVPQASIGFETYSATQIHGSMDIKLSPALLGALTALKQPVPGMDAKNDASMVDYVQALPLKKWQAFLESRAKAAAGKTYQCPALNSLNTFAKTASNPPVQMPPEADSLQGFRLVIDKWEIGPQIAARVLVASSNPSALVQKIQQTLPQFALKTIPTDGKPVAFDLPPRAQAMLGGGNQGWIAANQDAVVVGIGTGEQDKLSDALNASAGNGDKLMRVHIDGKMYPLIGSWMGRFAAMMPADKQAQLQEEMQAFNRLGKLVKSTDMDVKLDDKGLHIDSTAEHL